MKPRDRVVGVVALAVAMISALTLSGTEVGQTEELPAAKASPELIARGKYLVQAADCSSCHTAPGGSPYAGGLPLQSDFGTIYTTNITPDAEYGIGRWSADDLWHALHDGVTRNGTHLYPAMPYTSYRGMTRADSDAIYAYLMHLRPMHVSHPKTSLHFPYNIRSGMAAWNALFLRDRIPSASAGSAATWQRGRYLIDVLGHCGECHTPRGWLGQLKLSRTLTGNVLGRFEAPNITPAALVSRGWTEAGLRAFLGDGLAPQGSAFSEMHPVIAASTHYLSAADLQAAVTYLLGEHPPSLPPPRAEVDPAAFAAGRKIYVQVCAGCHGLEGEGKPHTAVALQANSTLRLANSRNLIVSVLHGIDAADFPGLERMQAMPGFADELSDEQVADLANYLRAGWGGQNADVTARAVHSLR
jgi:mono/diheme cytochrome c family protein